MSESDSKPLVNPVANATRRRVLIIAAAGISAAIALPTAIRNRVKQRTSVARAPDLAPTLNTLCWFMATLFGHALRGQDVEELRDRLSYTVDQDPTRARDYLLLSRELDRLAHNFGSESFAATDEARRAAIVGQIMQIDASSLRVRLLAHLSPESYRRYRSRLVLPALAWLYRHSGVPWRARGYTRWPGIPGSWREYLKPGNAYP